MLEIYIEGVKLTFSEPHKVGHQDLLTISIYHNIKLILIEICDTNA